MSLIWEILPTNGHQPTHTIFRRMFGLKWNEEIQAYSTHHISQHSKSNKFMLSK